MIALTALGNRQWGAGVDKGYPSWIYSKWLATIMMMLGVVIGAHYSLWAWPVIAVSIFLFRVWGTNTYFMTFSADEWEAAYKRSGWLVSVGACMSLLQHSMWPYAKSFIAVWAIPGVYYLTEKLAEWINSRDIVFLNGYRIDGTAIAEIVVGMIIGFISV